MFKALFQRFVQRRVLFVSRTCLHHSRHKVRRLLSTVDVIGHSVLTAAANHGDIEFVQAMATSLEEYLTTGQVRVNRPMRWVLFSTTNVMAQLVAPFHIGHQTWCSYPSATTVLLNLYFSILNAT